MQISFTYISNFIRPIELKQSGCASYEGYHEIDLGRQRVI